MSNLSGSDRALRLLKNILAPLESGEKQSFYKMLEIMQAHGNLHAQQLAESIKAFVRGLDPVVNSEAIATPTEGTYINTYLAINLYKIVHNHAFVQYFYIVLLL